MPDAYVDVCTVQDDHVRLYLAVGRGEADWTETRMVLLDAQGQVGQHDVLTRVISVDASPHGLELAGLGMSGVVSLATQQGVVFEQIDGFGTGAGRFGYASRIRFVGRELLACGDMRQVYRRTPTGWERFDDGLRVEDPKAIGCALNDITGSSLDRVFAVGDRGKIYLHDLEGWHDCAAPTNVSLERVLMDEQGTVWACGAAGTLLRGDGQQWAVIDFEPAADETFWAMARFKGETYVCSSHKLYKEKAGELVAVDGLPAGMSPHRLCADAHHLWVLSAASLVKFDGSAWAHVLP